MSRAVLPGSFDPFTAGHLDIAARAAQLVDELVIAVSHNPRKTPLLDLETRLASIRAALDDAAVAATVEPLPAGLLVDFAAARGIGHVVKGIRNPTDLAYEEPMARMNHRLRGIDTVFLLAAPHLTDVSSSLIKEVAALGGDITGLVPPAVLGPVHDALSARTAAASGDA